jgi:hypothetical protein
MNNLAHLDLSEIERSATSDGVFHRRQVFL